LSEGAVEARLQRGKIYLRRLLKSDYRSEAVAFGLADAPSSPWVETRLWCPICGKHHLSGVLPRNAAEFELHCPYCSWDPHSYFAQSTMIPEFAQVNGYRATLKRLMAHIEQLFAPRVTGQTIPCQRCGTPVPIQYELPASVHRYPNLGRRGVYILCPRCGSTSYSDIYGLALNSSAGQRFWREHPRMRVQPELEIRWGELPALQLRFESLKDNAALDVILSRERYVVVGISTQGIPSI
jgi:DNA-directed RNA polymerase subunit RPC12/RpoP